MKYKWTGWITHIPGQQVPIGMHILVEQKRRDGTTFQQEGTVTSKQRNHPTWFAKDHLGKYTMITRYKIRAAASENETTKKKKEKIDA